MYRFTLTRCSMQTTAVPVLTNPRSVKVQMRTKWQRSQCRADAIESIPTCALSSL